MPTATQTPATATRAVEAIQIDLGKAQAAAAKLNYFDDKYAAAEAKVSALAAELEVAQVAGMPELAELGIPHTIEPVALKSIVLNGNHRDTSKIAEPGKDAALLALANSMRVILLHPISVRKLRDDEAKLKGDYKLICGSRRYAAAQLNGWKEITARVFAATITDAQVEMLRTMENMHSKGLTPVEDAIAVARMIDALGKIDPASDKETHAQLSAAGGPIPYAAQLLGRPEKWVRDHAYVHRLGGKARELLADRRINIEHARKLAALGDAKVADALAEEVARDSRGIGGKDLSYLERKIAEHTRNLRLAPWKLDQPFAKEIACIGCPSNSASDPILFNGDGHAPIVNVDDPNAGAGTCTNETCFNTKAKAAEGMIAKALEKTQQKVKREEIETLSEGTIGDMAPEAIRPAVFVRRAKQTIEPQTGKSAGKAGTKGKSADAKAPKVDPIKHAKNLYREKLNSWKRDAGKAIADKVNKNPMSRLMMLLLDNTGFFGTIYQAGPGGFSDQDEKSNNAHDAKATRVAANSNTKALLRKLVLPSAGDFLPQAKNLRPISADAFARLVPEAVIVLANLAGTDPGTMPTLELPEADKTEAAEQAKPKSRKQTKREAKAARKSKAKAAAK